MDSVSVTEEDTDFDRSLLAALRELAVRSPRAQADVQAALFRARIDAAPEIISASLARLEDLGLIRDIITLHDGGILVTVSLAVN